MNLKSAKTKDGTRYYFEMKRAFGAVRYTADCAGICFGPDGYKRTWHVSLTDARKAAQERGTILENRED